MAAGQACNLAVSSWDCVQPDAEVAMEVATDGNAPYKLYWMSMPLVPPLLLDKSVAPRDFFVL